MAVEDFEDLDISQLAIQMSFNGIYRGQKVHRAPAFGDLPEVVVARVFLDTAGGPVAVKVDERAIAQIEALGVVEGDAIIVSRLAEEDYSVVKEVAEG